MVIKGKIRIGNQGLKPLPAEAVLQLLWIHKNTDPQHYIFISYMAPYVKADGTDSLKDAEWRSFRLQDIGKVRLRELEDPEKPFTMVTPRLQPVRYSWKETGKRKVWGRTLENAVDSFDVICAERDKPQERKPPVKPGMMLKSGRAEAFHDYWRSSYPLDRDRWLALTKAITHSYGYDVHGVNFNRRMRLAGYRNWKYPDAWSELVYADPDVVMNPEDFFEDLGVKDWDELMARWGPGPNQSRSGGRASANRAEEGGFELSPEQKQEVVYLWHWLGDEKAEVDRETKDFCPLHETTSGTPQLNRNTRTGTWFCHGGHPGGSRGGGLRKLRAEVLAQLSDKDYVGLLEGKRVPEWIEAQEDDDDYESLEFGGRWEAAGPGVIEGLGLRVHEGEADALRWGLGQFDLEITAGIQEGLSCPWCNEAGLWAWAEMGRWGCRGCGIGGGVEDAADAPRVETPIEEEEAPGGDEENSDEEPNSPPGREARFFGLRRVLQEIQRCEKKVSKAVETARAGLLRIAEKEAAKSEKQRKHRQRINTRLDHADLRVDKLVREGKVKARRLLLGDGGMKANDRLSDVVLQVERELSLIQALAEAELSSALVEVLEEFGEALGVGGEIGKAWIKEREDAVLKREAQRIEASAASFTRPGAYRDEENGNGRGRGKTPPKFKLEDLHDLLQSQWFLPPVGNDILAKRLRALTTAVGNCQTRRRKRAHVFEYEDGSKVQHKVKSPKLDDCHHPFHHCQNRVLKKAHLIFSHLVPRWRKATPVERKKQWTPEQNEALEWLSDTMSALPVTYELRYPYRMADGAGLSTAAAKEVFGNRLGYFPKGGIAALKQAYPKGAADPLEDREVIVRVFAPEYKREPKGPGGRPPKYPGVITGSGDLFDDAYLFFMNQADGGWMEKAETTRKEEIYAPDLDAFLLDLFGQPRVYVFGKMGEMLNKFTLQIDCEICGQRTHESGFANARYQKDVFCEHNGKPYIGYEDRSSEETHLEEWLAQEERVTVLPVTFAETGEEQPGTAQQVLAEHWSPAVKKSKKQKRKPLPLSILSLDETARWDVSVLTTLDRSQLEEAVKEAGFTEVGRVLVLDGPDTGKRVATWRAPICLALEIPERNRDAEGLVSIILEVVRRREDIEDPSRWKPPFSWYGYGDRWREWSGGVIRARGKD